jgi:hypothetical protein
LVPEESAADVSQPVSFTLGDCQSTDSRWAVKFCLSRAVEGVVYIFGTRVD